MMEVFVARQPILDVSEQLIGYELLYRNGQADFFNHLDGDKATIDVLVNSFISIGVDNIANKKKCFINFTENLLLQEFPAYFPAEYVVVEILETIQPTPEIIKAIQKLKELGYTIALDDFIYDDRYMELVKLADIIKVEFPRASAEQHYKLINIARTFNIKLLAEKVETRQEFELAVKLGYDYFQGYFFSKPTVIKATDIPSYSHVYLEIIQEISKDTPDIDAITRLIERDLSLSYKLLKLINSAGFQLRTKITSLKQAIVLLGLKEVRKWTSIISLSSMGKDVSFQAIELCLSRAKMGELLSFHLRKDQSEFFLLGMFSLIDTILHRPMEDAVKVLPFSQDIKDALLGSNNVYGDTLELMKSLENGEWDTFSTLSQKLGISEEESMNCYAKAVEWSTYIVDIVQAS
ncbi:EAL and HDOD domain-containing protein [Bacillus pinisoli]|uniref:EAL and HDOD domain-containing protein n=1 Tax=Bacillus pinisoli TaxID=2901866 RepID=UPI001FF619F4|nr:HDOD domain-containing protein [Bacillus pinisoli]